MPHARPNKRKKTPERVLALPDLEHAKPAVLNSLTSRSGQRTDARRGVWRGAPGERDQLPGADPWAWEVAEGAGAAKI